MPAVPPSDVADRQHRPAGYRAADAGVVPRHATARPGKKGLSNIELRQRLELTNAAWQLQHKLMQAMVERTAAPSSARAATDRDRRRLYRRRAPRGRLRTWAPQPHPFIIAVETTAEGQPLYARLQVVRGPRPPKPSGYAPVWRLERPSSATAGSGFVVLRGSRLSLTNAASPAPVSPPPDTPPPLGKYRARNVKNSLSATHHAVTAEHLPRYLGAFA